MNQKSVSHRRVPLKMRVVDFLTKFKTKIKFSLAYTVSISWVEKLTFFKIKFSLAYTLKNALCHHSSGGSALAQKLNFHWLYPLKYTVDVRINTFKLNLKFPLVSTIQKTGWYSSKSIISSTHVTNKNLLSHWLLPNLNLLWIYLTNV